jgi:hypothetical protein
MHMSARKKVARGRATAPARKPAAKAAAPEKRGSTRAGPTATAALPKPGAGAELIVRQGFIIDATGNGLHAVPEVAMLGNRAAFEYLAGVFEYLAAQARQRAGTAEPVELPRNAHPINVRLSDDLDFQFALLTDANRKAMLKRFGVDMKSRQKGSLFERYQEVLTQFPRLTNQMRRMDELPMDAARTE